MDSAVYGNFGKGERRFQKTGNVCVWCDPHFCGYSAAEVRGLVHQVSFGGEAPAWGAVLLPTAGGLVRGVGGLVWKGWDCEKRGGSVILSAVLLPTAAPVR